MERQVLPDEAGDEEIAVVVALLHPQGQRLTRLPASGLEEMRTKLFFQERVVTGARRSGDFLARRLRRLLPALLVMLLTVLLLAPIFLSSYEAKLQTGSFVFASTWASNFYFALTEFDYFVALSAKDLFLHTW